MTAHEANTAFIAATSKREAARRAVAAAERSVKAERRKLSLAEQEVARAFRVYMAADREERMAEEWAARPAASLNPLPRYQTCKLVER